jgi:predicted transcriptional regulator
VKAKDIMTTPVITVTRDTGIKELARILIEKNISGVPVIDGKGALVGIVSEADLMPLEAVPTPEAMLMPVPRTRPPRTVSDIMQSEVIALPAEADVSWIAQTILKNRVKRVPIVSRERVVGIVSRQDLLRVLAADDREVQIRVQSLLHEEAEVIGLFAVDVKDGIATLTGPEDKRSRKLADRLARAIPGVIEVVFAEELVPSR